MIGAYRKAGFRGTVYVIYGKGETRLNDLDISVQPSTLSPSSTGFIIKADKENRLGYSISRAGRSNGAGHNYDDILIGAPRRDSNRGTVWK